MAELHEKDEKKQTQAAVHVQKRSKTLESALQVASSYKDSDLFICL